LSGRGLCDELITRPEESYRLCCVVVCDLETSRIGAPYIYDISNLRVNKLIIQAANTTIFFTSGITNCHHHHHHPGLGHLARSVSRVTVAVSIVSSVSQLFSFLVGCSGIILKGFGFVAFFAGVKGNSFCIHLSCLVRSLSVVRGVWCRLFCGHKGCSLPEVSITSFLPPQFFGSVRLPKSSFLTHRKM